MYYDHNGIEWPWKEATLTSILKNKIELTNRR